MIINPKKSMDQKINITLWSAVFFLCAVTASAADRPNILFIITDQHHLRMLSSADNPYLKTAENPSKKRK